MASMIEAVRYTGIHKQKLREMAITGQIPGAERGKGRTGAWRIPLESLESLRSAARSNGRAYSFVASGPRGLKKLTVEDLKLDELGLSPSQWLTLDEAADLIDVNASTLATYARAGKIASQVINFGKRPVRIVSVDGLDKLNIHSHTQKRAAKSPAPQPPTRPATKNLTISELATAAGVSNATAYRYVENGALNSTKVQMGPRQYRWLTPESEVEKLIALVEPKGRRAAGLGYVNKKFRHQYHTPTPQPRPTVTIVDLTQKLLDLADLVRNNPMVSVEACEVSLKFKG